VRRRRIRRRAIYEHVLYLPACLPPLSGVRPICARSAPPTAHKRSISPRRSIAIFCTYSAPPLHNAKRIPSHDSLALLTDGRRYSAHRQVKWGV